MIRLIAGLLYALTLHGVAIGQAPDSTRPCIMPEASQFDFWLGHWDLTWSDSGRGTNVITKPLGDCVVMEQFAEVDSNGLRGMSTSVFDTRSRMWQQTWVDNQGSYMVFTGTFADGRMILSRETIGKDGLPVIQRMVWRDITPNRFIWDWQSSADSGASWKTNWSITYTRRE